MSDKKLTGEDLGHAIMLHVWKCIDMNAKAQVEYLRHGAKTRVDEVMGEHILSLASVGLTQEQIDHLEVVLHEVQEASMAAFLGLIDGLSQPPGFPDRLRLVNMDTGEAICPQQLHWVFAEAKLDWLEKRDTGHSEDSDD